MGKKKKKKRATHAPREAKDKGGRPEWKPTAKQLKEAEECARLGLNRVDIAWNLNVVPATLYAAMKRFPELLEALEGGKARAKKKIRSIVYEEANKRAPWAVMGWMRYNDPPPTRVTLEGDPEKPLVFLGKIHGPIKVEVGGDAFAILEAARRAKLQNKKGRKSKTK